MHLQINQDYRYHASGENEDTFDVNKKNIKA